MSGRQPCFVPLARWSRAMSNSNLPCPVYVTLQDMPGRDGTLSGPSLPRPKVYPAFLCLGRTGPRRDHLASWTCQGKGPSPKIGSSLIRRIACSWRSSSVCPKTARQGWSLRLLGSSDEPWLLIGTARWGRGPWQMGPMLHRLGPGPYVPLPGKMLDGAGLDLVRLCVCGGRSF
jgi:hypothetical protein